MLRRNEILYVVKNIHLIEVLATPRKVMVICEYLQLAHATHWAPLGTRAATCTQGSARVSVT
jgi:hypothetical protein